MSGLDPAHVERFYRSALIGLAALDARGGQRRRFGAEADAAWKAFRGELTDNDRLDLLIREAAATHQAAFAPRILFSLDGLLEDEPFGPDWPGLPAGLATGLLREVETAPAEGARVTTLLAEIAHTWRGGSVLPSMPQEALERITPATRILAAGMGAILALAARFVGRRDMDLADQVVLLANQPGERQLFSLAAALLDSPRPVRIFTAAAPEQLIKQLRTIGVPHVHMGLASDEAAPELREAVAAVMREMDHP